MLSKIAQHFKIFTKPSKGWEILKDFTSGGNPLTKFSLEKDQFFNGLYFILEHY
jgi:hypothetical protein